MDSVGCGFGALSFPHKWEFYAEGGRTQIRRLASEGHDHQARGMDEEGEQVRHI